MAEEEDGEAEQRREEDGVDGEPDEPEAWNGDGGSPDATWAPARANAALADAEAASTSSPEGQRGTKALPIVAAHRHSRAPLAGEKLRHRPKPTHGLHAPGAVGSPGHDGTAATLQASHKQRPRPPLEHRPFMGMMHQALPLRNNPDPIHWTRWPENGWVVGGPPGSADTRRSLINFGFGAHRGHSTFASKASQDPNPKAHTLTFEEVKAGLTKQFGSLRSAFDALDFFKDGQLSPLEWQDGVYNALHKIKGEEGLNYRALCFPRSLYNKRMTQIFRSMDINGDGLITFEELSRDFVQIVESSHDFTMRRQKENLQDTLGIADADDLTSEAEAAMRALASHPDFRRCSLSLDFGPSGSPLGMSPVASSPGLTTAATSVAGDGERKKHAKGSEAARIFATLLLQKYPSVEEAFKALDVNGNGELSMAEFVEGCKERVRWGGDARAVFKEIDTDGSGSICQHEFKRLRRLRQVEADVAAQARVRTKREIAESRRRTDVEDPPPHHRGKCLDDLRHLPLGRFVSTTAGFHTFARSSTGRMDASVHPEAMPGFDLECFSGERGPGHFKKGPESYSEIGCHEHPRRGTSWKIGATRCQTERFSPPMPSKQGKDDVELSGKRYASYGGQVPGDTWSIHGSGACQFGLERTGRPGHCDSSTVEVRKKIFNRMGHSSIIGCKRTLSSPILRTPAF